MIREKNFEYEEPLLQDTEKGHGHDAMRESNKRGSNLWEQGWWMLLHGLAFFIGGSTFIAGTSCYYFFDWQAGAEWAGWLYVIGSCGFMSVDTLEFFTFTEDPYLRANIAMSASGSFAYILGSIGFLPSVQKLTPYLGIWGFIVGSALIGVSQLIKCNRILRNHTDTRDTATQIGVELSAGLGAWSFFIGTIMYLVELKKLTETARLLVILDIWVVGSILFTFGALFLNYRHWVMKV